MRKRMIVVLFLLGVALLSRSGAELAILRICKKMKLSVSAGIKFNNEFVSDEIIVDSGKKETDNGRRPSLYKVDPEIAYCIGTVVQLKGISTSIYNMEMNEIYSDTDENFVQEILSACFENVVGFIRRAVDNSQVDLKRILGMGIGITGDVNEGAGYSHNYFNFLEGALVIFFPGKFDFSCYVDNDTCVLGITEQYFGKARNIQNVFELNLCCGVGLAIIANGDVIGGEQGGAGELGHIQLVDSTRFCLFGKRGCLGTEVGAHVLEQNFQEHIEKDENSVLVTNKNLSGIKYQDILEAASEGDALSIWFVHNIGFMLGKAMGNMINLLKPGIIIIGGGFTLARDILTDSVKLGISHTALSLSLRNCELMFSSTEDATIKGAGAIVFRSLQLI